MFFTLYCNSSLFILPVSGKTWYACMYLISLYLSHSVELLYAFHITVVCSFFSVSGITWHTLHVLDFSVFVTLY